MNYQSLIASIQAAIYNNGEELITGNVLQGVLLDMVNALDSAGATFGGTITPASAAPADLDQPTVYLALTAGTYEHFLDGEGDPIETTGPALVIYDGGPALNFTKTDLPSGGSGATVITASPGDSLVVTLPNGDEGIKASYRIDMTAAVYGGDVDARYIGSLIIEANDLAMQTAHGYYYGDDMDEILSEVAIWKDDPEFYPDEQRYFLLLTTDSNLNEVIFSISSLDGQSVDAVAANEDEMVKVADATITPVGSGGGDGKMGVISQTQTWSGTGSNPRTYVMSNLVTGLIPQANIDLFESAGATFNESTGYFELNGLTDISYEEMKVIYWLPVLSQEMSSRYLSTRIRTTLSQIGRADASNGGAQFVMGNSFNTSYIEVVSLVYSHNSGVRCKGMGNTFLRAYYLRKILDVLHLELDNPYMSNDFGQCYSLEYVHIKSNGKDILLPDSSLLAEESLLYMINNAGTNAFTITLHASVYAKCQSGGEWYSDISTALASHTNVTLASA